MIQCCSRSLYNGNWVRIFRNTPLIQKRIGGSVKTVRTPHNVKRVIASVKSKLPIVNYNIKTYFELGSKVTLCLVVVGFLNHSRRSDVDESGEFLGEGGFGRSQ